MTDRLPAHTVRMPDEIWLPALALARESGETVSAVIRRALIEYVRGAPEITRALARARLEQILADDAKDNPAGHPCRGCGRYYVDHFTQECEGWH